MKNKEERLDGVFDKYGGEKRFLVSHPETKKQLRIAAPNEDAAIVAAAKCLGRRWTEYEFYAYCEVTRA